MFSIEASSVLISPPTEFRIGNTTYTVNQPMNFFLITIDSAYIIFNEIKFTVISERGCLMRLVYLTGDISGAGAGGKILDFYMYPESQLIWFNLGGFRAGIEYRIVRDDKLFLSVTADGSGYISFLNNEWATHHFVIYQQSSSPDWDINTDGICNLIDFVLVSNHLGERGEAGWIREDIDKNGIIQVADVVALSGHYGQQWTI